MSSGWSRERPEPGRPRGAGGLVLMEFAFDARTEPLRVALVDFITVVMPNSDHWLTSMNRLQQRIGAAAVQDRGEDPA
jgi:hypothetical protein